MGKETEKIDNCFIDELSNYEYDIVDDNGEVIARAKSLSAIDNSVIQKHGFAIARNEDGSLALDKRGFPQYDIDYINWILYTVKQALISWKWDRPITIENIALLNEKTRNMLFQQIRAHEGFFDTNREAIEKN